MESKYGTMVGETELNYKYRNNNPGNIKVSSNWTGDFYIGTGGVEKYKKFDTKAMGLAAIIDTMKNYAETDINKIMDIYAKDDTTGKANPNYAQDLKNTFEVMQTVDFDDDAQLLNLMKGITTMENTEDAKNYYTEKDYNDALKLYRESKLFGGQGSIDEQIKDAEMKGLSLQ